jgi:hypothetical protein
MRIKRIIYQVLINITKGHPQISFPSVHLDPWGSSWSFQAFTWSKLFPEPLWHVLMQQSEHRIQQQSSAVSCEAWLGGDRQKCKSRHFSTTLLFVCFGKQVFLVKRYYLCLIVFILLWVYYFKWIKYFLKFLVLVSNTVTNNSFNLYKEKHLVGSVVSKSIRNLETWNLETIYSLSWSLKLSDL